jgi:DNA-binding NarL/FixJ family response regulator
LIADHDVVMQPMDGFTLRDEMQRRYPNVRTIFISGYDLSEHVEQIRGGEIIAKPVEPEVLLQTIERVFGPKEKVLAARTTLIRRVELPPRTRWRQARAAAAGAVLDRPELEQENAPSAGMRTTTQMSRKLSRTRRIRRWAGRLGPTESAAGSAVDDSAIRMRRCRLPSIVRLA